MGSQIAVEVGVVGSDLEVPLVGGARARYVNLDYAASAPPLGQVWEAVQAFLPWYSSVHRGAGLKSEVATAAYESARDQVRTFVGARTDDAVIFTRNTTDAINLLARCIPSSTVVITTGVEHHANLLPWRLHGAVELPVPGTPDELLEAVDLALYQRGSRHPALLAVTGASNVTGEIWPLAELASLAHRHGARIFVDAAQLAPHRAIEMAELDLDWIAFSGHKLYAPFGSGALIGRTDWLAAAKPYLFGGGTVVEVSEEDVLWVGLPARHEGGSPNVIGAVALGAACRVMAAIGMAEVACQEKRLAEVLDAGLDRVPGLVRYQTWPDPCERLGIACFNLRDRDHAEVASILSAEYGIGVRSGSFCAHPLLVHLAGIDRWKPGCGMSVPGAVRASFGLGTGVEGVQRLVQALHEISECGPRWQYRQAPDGGIEPVPDDRSRPELPLLGTSFA